VGRGNGTEKIIRDLKKKKKAAKKKRGGGTKQSLTELQKTGRTGDSENVVCQWKKLDGKISVTLLEEQGLK